MKKTRLGFYLITIMLIFSTLSMLSPKSNEHTIYKDNTNYNSSEPNASDYWDNFTYIHINNNWSLFGSWLKGDGSWGNPYRIENMTINATNSVSGSGIFIENSLKDYFEYIRIIMESDIIMLPY